MSDTTETNVVSIFDICETDTNAEEQGRWFRDIFGDGTNIDIKLRRLSSKPSMTARRRLDKGYRKHMKGGVYPEHIAIEVLVKQLAEAVIVDWKGIFDREGQAIPFSPEKAQDLLTKLPTFRDIIVAMSNNLDNFRVEEQEEIAKN